MSNQLTNTEKKFKNAADNLEVNISSEGLWTALEPELPPVQKNKKKIFPLWWIGIGAMILIGLMMTNWFNASETPLTKKASESSINYTTKTSTSSIKNKEDLNVNTSLVKTPKKENSRNINTRENHSNIAFLTKNPNTNRTKNIMNYEKELSSTLTKKDPIPFLPGVQNKLDNIQEESFLVNRLTNKIPTLTSEVYFENQVSFNAKADVIKPLRKNTKWYIHFASGINQNWSQTSIKDLNHISDNRFAKERDVYGMTSSLMFGLQKNNWSFALGVSHSMQASQYTQVEKVITKKGVTGVVQTQISDSGIKTEFQGQVIATTIHYYDILWHRIHNGVDVQSEIGRTVYQKGGFSMKIYVGLGYNLWTKHTGYYLSPGEGSITKIVNSNAHPYKNMVGVSYNGAISLNYDLGRMNIGLSPFIKYSNTSILKNSAFYTLKNSQYGLQVRMTFRP